MSDNQVERAWEQRIISRVMGKRVVHYRLLDTTPNSLIAVVGIERSRKHITYTVTEEFLQVFGSTSTVHARTRWHSRKAAVAFLNTIAKRGGPIFADSNQQKIDSTPHGNSTDEEIQGSTRLVAKHRATVGSKRVREKCKTTHRRIKIKFAQKEVVDNKLVMCNSERQALSERDENIELLSEESGKQGCWFRCKILHSSSNLLRVQYYDAIAVNGQGKLEEWVPKDRVAAPNVLGVRCGGRLTVRPWPRRDSSELKFEKGTAVDAWLCDGWWEGVVLALKDESANSDLVVFFPGENKFMTVERKNIRISKDWINDQWVDVKGKPDIVAFLTSYLSPRPVVQLPRINTSTLAIRNVPNSSKVEESRAVTR